MKPINDGGPAFPTIPSGYVAEEALGRWTIDAVDDSLPIGMSLRDYFAGQALIGILCARNGFLVDVGVDNAAQWAFQCADKMIEERTKAEEES